MTSLSIVARGTRPSAAYPVLAATALASLLGACGDDPPAPRTPSMSSPSTPAAAPAASKSEGFEERAEAAGIRFRMNFLPAEQGKDFKINLYDHGCAVAVGDYDGDGLDDVYFCNELGPNALYRNVGDGVNGVNCRFEDVTSSPIDMPGVISVAAAWGDYDADGREDLYVATTMGGNSLFHNDGGGHFTDVTEKAFGKRMTAHSQSVTWFDSNGDGFLDLFVSNTAKWTYDEADPATKARRGARTLLDLVLAKPETSALFRNRGDGTFEDVTEAVGLGGTGWSGDTAVFDYDEDGDVDVVVANMFGASRLYENDGKGFFTDVTKRVLGRISWGGVGCKAFDYDDDGHLDLFLVDMHSDMTWMDASYVPNKRDAATKFPGLGGPKSDSEIPADQWDVLRRLDVRKDDVVFGNTLFHAKGGGKFEEVSDRAHLETLWPWGIAAADYDGDGFEDLYLPSGMGYPFVFLPSLYFQNSRDGTFREATAEAGLRPLPGGDYASERIDGKPVAKSARSAANADFDGDGRMDIVVNNFNDRAYLYMNRFPARTWVGFRLTGAGGNRDAIGAVVRIQVRGTPSAERPVGGKTLSRLVQAAGGYLAQSSLLLHFGLDGVASKDEIESVEITWPGGKKQAVKEFELGRVNRVEQAK